MIPLMGVDSISLNVAQAIARDIRERILSGELKPETRLTQRYLAAEFGYSPMPARDAVKMLLTEGLLVQEGSKTIVVAPTNVEDFNEIMEIRLLMEPEALALSIPRLKPAHLEEARQALDLSGRTEEPRQMVNDHWRFHRAIYQAAPRPRLLALIDHHHNLLIRYTLADWAEFGVMQHWADDERELMALIEQKQVAEAIDWLRCDLRKAVYRVENLSIAD
jgi:DNA-binding GntR family transcriptional regulator